MKCRITTAVNPALRDIPKELTQWSAREMAKVRDDMDREFRKQRARVFATEGGETGRVWQRLSPEYAKRKRNAAADLRERKSWRSGRALTGSISSKVMQYSGKLRRSLTQKDGQHVATYRFGQKASVTLGTENIIAAYHAKPKWSMGANPLYNKNLPDRDVMEHMPKHVDALKKTFAPHWKAKLARLTRLMIAKQRELTRRSGGSGGGGA